METPPVLTTASPAGGVPNPSGSRLVYAIFLLSGTAALIYEISWSRQIGLLFGHTAQAAAVVLWAYFTGLGLGYAVGGPSSQSSEGLRDC